ncbi:MAG TPA: hypothetical protein VG406_02345 [Isosphaeraceae bacterium]|jgi:hypothetical protein|nr:hypothetical protein [Isosphaeraceae bacterium]
MRDIYDPPPAPLPFDPPRAEPIAFTRSDLAFLVASGFVLVAAGLLAWRVEPSLAPLVWIGGTLVVVESWFTALGFLHRHPAEGLRGRLMIFVAALVPWLLGLGVAAALMAGLFRLSDWLS